MCARIQKVLNNNVLIILDEKDEETVAMGRGIGFQKKAGETVSYGRIEKTFVLSEEKLNTKLRKLLSVLPTEHFILSEKIIEHVKSVTGWQLSDNIYITLTDHISAAITRNKNQVPFENPLHWDIKYLYPEEYLLGMTALDSIQEETGIRFCDDEASYLALHFVNARINTDENMEFVHQVTKIIREITGIIKYHFHMEHPPESLEYYQFVNYIKSLSPQIIRGDSDFNDYPELLAAIPIYYSSVVPCMEKITAYLKSQYHYQANGEERFFISMSLSRINKRLDENQRR